jgi:hypothetical protein
MSPAGLCRCVWRYTSTIYLHFYVETSARAMGTLKLASCWATTVQKRWLLTHMADSWGK